MRLSSSLFFWGESLFRCCGSAIAPIKNLQVDSKINLPTFAAALQEGGNRDVTTKELANLNHLFQTCKTGAVAEYGTIEETMSSEVLQTIGDWIQQRTGKSSR
jgi:hypothetical protein